MLCKCMEEKGSHRVEGMVRFNYAPLDDGGHTAFELLVCKECHGFCGFPPSNFELARKKGDAWTKATLAEYGVPEEDFLSPASLEPAEPKIVDMEPRTVWEG